MRRSLRPCPWHTGPSPVWGCDIGFILEWIESGIEATFRAMRDPTHHYLTHLVGCARGAAVALGVVLAACGGDEDSSHTAETLADTLVEADAPDVPADDAIAGDLLDAPAPDAPDTSDPSDTGVPIDTWVTPPDRAPGERAPLTARCDDSEPARCLLPWPSSAFLARDASRPTGVRLQLAPDVLASDEGAALLEGDGFSRVTPILTLAPTGLDPSSFVVRVFVAEPGEGFGVEVPIDTYVAKGRDASDRDTLVGYPLRPLRAASEHLVIVESRRQGQGAAPEPTSPAHRAARIALGLTPAENPSESARAAYFAPARELLHDTAIDASRVVALWDFVTRSADDPRERLRALADDARARVADGRAALTLTRVTPGAAPPIAVVAEGHIDGLVDPTEDPALTFGVPFRVVVPTGDGDYRVTLYGHGTGGDVGDTSFDGLITGAGSAKVNVEIDGWTGDTVAVAISGLLVPIPGTDHLVRRMRRAIAGIAAIQRAVHGPLGELLAAPTLLDTPNPAAGRRPLAALPIWTGGSLGGVIGCVYGHLEPSIAGGVLNVPGAAFTHWLARSSLGGVLDLALDKRYPAMVDQQLVAAMSQSLWDEVDGSQWADARAEPPIWLVQMSVGDPVMPNNATAMVATAVGATMLIPDGVSPMVPVQGLPHAPSVVGRSALTEFRTEETGPSAIHGFTARNSAAGAAARAQVEAFIASLWAGAPTITLPEACLALPAPGVCDFVAPAP